MSIENGSYYGGGDDGPDPSISLDAINSFLARWPRAAQWWPDLTQVGFPVAAPNSPQRFAGAEALVEPVGTTFANSIRHRTFATPGTVATQAVVLRDASGSLVDGNQTLAALTGGEVYAVVRWDAMAALQWGVVGMFSTAGSFPFPDLWSLDNICGYGWTSLGTPTPVGNVQALSRDATALSRADAGVRAVGSWQVVSARLYPPSDPDGARLRVRAYDAQTGAQTFDVTLPTNIPASGRLHAGIIASNGNAGGGVGRGAVGMSLAFWGVGIPP